MLVKSRSTARPKEKKKKIQVKNPKLNWNEISQEHELRDCVMIPVQRDG